MDDQINQTSQPGATDPLGQAPANDSVQPAVSEPTPPSANPGMPENKDEVMAALTRIEDKIAAIATKVGA